MNPTPSLAPPVQGLEQLNLQQQIRHQMKKTGKDAMAVITTTLLYTDYSNISASRAAETARAAFVAKAEARSVQYAAHRYMNHYQLTPEVRRTEANGVQAIREDERSCAAVAMKAATVHQDSALMREFVSTIQQDSTVWRVD